MQVVVEKREQVAVGIVRFMLRAATPGALPAFTAGSHIDLRLPNGLTRQYSLINDCREADRYEIAVSHAAESRGGSAWIHANLAAGDRLEISEPRNNFPLRPGHERFFFVAGGIGITPILSMIRWCETRCWGWQLLYLARSRAYAAFQQDIIASRADRVRFHFDDEVGGRFDFASPGWHVEAGVPIYCCGPTPVMQAVESFAARHPENPAFFEWFSPPPAHMPAATNAFEVKLQRSERTLQVPEGQSILEVLEAHGYELPNSCREGMCRTCETRVIEGTPDHRDYVLSREEQRSGRTMCICVSRSKSAVLVLDL